LSKYQREKERELTVISLTSSVVWYGKLSYMQSAIRILLV
jgi:hypothetical protein